MGVAPPLPGAGSAGLGPQAIERQGASRKTGNLSTTSRKALKNHGKRQRCNTGRCNTASPIPAKCLIFRNPLDPTGLALVDLAQAAPGTDSAQLEPTPPAQNTGRAAAQPICTSYFIRSSRERPKHGRDT